MRTLLNFARLVIAPVFIFSGFVKLIDPLGFTYKFNDYFEAFGLDFMSPLSFFLSVLVSTTELLVGLCLLMGILMRITSWVLMAFMTFFTILTFVIALTNPVTDCGCFGDALKLTNWQTFWKNIIFLAPAIVVFTGRRRFKPITNLAAEWSVALLFVIIGISISIYSYRNLPILDFRPYKIGTNIPNAMSLPSGAPADSFETRFIYEKNGVKKEFAVEDLDITTKDTAWKYVDRKTKIIRQGDKPPIHDFSISTLDGKDITDSVLSDPGYSCLIIAYDLQKANADGLFRLNKFAATLAKQNVKIYGLTSSNSAAIAQAKKTYHFSYDYHTTDETTLKTIVRANPGVLLLKKGTIIAKWHFRNIPEITNANQDILSVCLQDQQHWKNSWVKIASVLFLFFVVFSLLLLIRYDN